MLTAIAETPAERRDALAAGDSAIEMFEALARESKGDRDLIRSTAQAKGTRVESLMSVGKFAEAEQAMAPIMSEMASLYEVDRSEMDTAANYWASIALGVEAAYRAGFPDIARQRVSSAQSVWLGLTGAVRESGAVVPFRDKIDYFGGLALLSGNQDEYREGCQRLRAMQARLPSRSRIAPGEFNDPLRFSQLGSAIASCVAASGSIS